jgi:hypothetical protein
VNDIL